MSYVTTGSGEVASLNVPQVQPSTVAPQSLVPRTLFVSNEYLPIRNSYMQMYPKYEPAAQAWDGTSSTQVKEVPVKKSSRTCQSLMRDLFRITFGIIICAIPLAVVSTLYGQQQANSSSSTTATTIAANISATNFTLPDQCNSYIINNDSTRNVASGTGTLCDNTLNRGWYRFTGGAGTQLATSAVSINLCSTSNTGFYNGSLPMTIGSTTFGILCLNNQGHTCFASWSGSLVAVTNCNGYYVYYLSPISNCASRYCTTA